MEKWPKHYDFKKAESFWQKKWEEWGIYRWSPDMVRDKTFVVDTPPPTVSGSLHIGHVFSYTHQDIIVRQRRMSGMNIYYPIGWDDNGLPTERRVQNYYNVYCDPEKPYEELDISDAPEKRKETASPVSRQNFIELCMRITERDEKEFENLFRMLGISVDWNEKYETINDISRRISQQSFIRLYEMGRVYSKEEPMMWDTDFRTAVAQAEVEDIIIKGAYHDLIFHLEGEGQFVISTTRPELLPACIAVAAHPDDMRYKSFFDKKAITPLFGVHIPVIASDSVDPEKGTGIMMICTFGDASDVKFWREHNLPLRQVIGKDGRFIDVRFGTGKWKCDNPQQAQDEYNRLRGKTVTQARGIITRMLGQGSLSDNRDVALKNPPIPCEHAVNFYEKGDRPIEFIPTRQWFVKILDLKEELLETGRKITWHPPHMLKRLEAWIEGLNYDWCISRQRYFGVPIPVWYRLDEDGEIIYDNPIVCENGTLPADPMIDPPHGYREDQRNKPDGFTGDPDVLDTWATSSMTPQISSRWEIDPERHHKLFPADLRPQAHEIIRTWAFYTVVKSLFHENKAPWSNILISGWVLDPDRKKMSKSKGNAVTPREFIEKNSADVMRYWAGSVRPGVDTLLDEGVIKIGRRLVTKLYNASKFTLSRVSTVNSHLLSAENVTEEIDRGMIGAASEMVTAMTTAFHNYDYSKALEITESFFWNYFCDFYIELVKKRAYEEEGAPMISALSTLKTCLSVLLRSFAPFLPSITEEIWSRYFAMVSPHPSIHIASWPDAEEFSDFPQPLYPDCLNAVMETVNLVRREKTRFNKSMNAPVKQLTIKGSPEDLKKLKPGINDIEQSLFVMNTIIIKGNRPSQALFEVSIDV